MVCHDAFVKALSAHGLAQLAESRAAKIRVGLVHQPHGRHKHDRRVAAAREEHAVGVLSELVRITDIGGSLIAARQSVGPCPVLT